MQGFGEISSILKNVEREHQEIFIRNSTVIARHRPSHVKLAENYKKSARKSFRRLFRRSKKRLIRLSVFTTNVALLGVVGFFAFQSHSAGAPQNSLSAAAIASGQANAQANPLDKLSSADVAVHIAKLTALPEAIAVSNEADSVSAGLAVAAADDRVIAKPQIVATNLKSKKDVKKYVAAEGDTVDSLAAKFGVTPDTIRVSNSLISDNIAAGTELIISPVTGIIYTVKPGDTPDSIATTFRADKDQMIAFNDAEPELKGGFKAGDQIVIPGGLLPIPVPVGRTAGPAVSTSFSISSGYSPLYNGNGYARGYCTWGVANLISIPNNWGNASTWDDYARRSGWIVSTNPTVGAIAQRDGGAGHVGIVTAVSEDGKMIKYKDMNGLAGFGRYGETTNWEPALSTYQRFISH